MQKISTLSEYLINHDRIKMKIIFILKLIIGILLIGLLLAIAGGITLVTLNKTTTILSKETTFSVKKGQTLSGIAESMESQGLIHSSLLLKLICRFFQTEKQIKAGYYHIPAGSTTVDIHR